MFKNYEEDDFFGPLLKVMDGQDLPYAVKDRKFKSLISMCHCEGIKIAPCWNAVHFTKICARHIAYGT